LITLSFSFLVLLVFFCSLWLVRVFSKFRATPALAVLSLFGVNYRTPQCTRRKCLWHLQCKVVNHLRHLDCHTTDVNPLLRIDRCLCNRFCTPPKLGLLLIRSGLQMGLTNEALSFLSSAINLPKYFILPELKVQPGYSSKFFQLASLSARQVSPSGQYSIFRMGCISQLLSRFRGRWRKWNNGNGNGASESHGLRATSYSPSIESQNIQRHEDRALNKHLNAHVI
jgi:hypothetical protein